MLPSCSVRLLWVVCSTVLSTFFLFFLMKYSHSWRSKGSSSSELDYLISFQPRAKEDFQALSSKIIEYIIKRHQNKPLYHSFIEHHVRELATPLKDVEVRKAASVLTTLANEKQKEQKEKASGGKKKSKAASKPGLGPAKVQNKCVPWLYAV